MHRTTSRPGRLSVAVRALVALTLCLSAYLATPARSFADTAPAPITREGRPEQNPLFLLPGHTYNLVAKHLVDGRQGVAWSEDGYYVSGSNSLTHYGLDFKPIATNINPLAEIPNAGNHLGDIAVYKGEIYASCEYFLDGVGSKIQIAVFGADDLKYRRSIEIAPESGQPEISGVAVDPENMSLWLCSWVGGTDNYIYRYDLETGAYVGKYHLQAPPQWIQGLAYHDGWLYLTADDGVADAGEPDHIWRCRVDLNSTSWLCTLERTLDDVTMQGEIEGITFNERANQLLVAYNHGARIVEGMVRGYYDGFTEEIHEVFTYQMSESTSPVDYTLDQCWISLPEHIDKKADTFYISPTSSVYPTARANTDFFDLMSIWHFERSLYMEQDIFDDVTNVYSPNYRQQKVACFLTDDGRSQTFMPRLETNTPQAALAYQDVRAAFLNFMETRSNRPFIIFGFSQGADMALRLIEEFGGTDAFKSRHIATYAIGTPITESYLASHPNVKMAQRATDTGVVISYNAYDVRAKPANAPKTVAINPLNWATDSSKATPYENLGYVTVDAHGNLMGDIPNFCGAHLDPATGLLLVEDMKDETPWTNFHAPFQQGDYHLLEIGLFYRNLEQNVAARVGAFRPAA